MHFHTFLYMLYIDDRCWVVVIPATTSIQHLKTSITVITHNTGYFINPSAYSITFTLFTHLIILFYLHTYTPYMCIHGASSPSGLIAAIHSAEFHFYSRLFSFLLLLRLHLPPQPPQNPFQVSFYVVSFCRSILCLLSLFYFSFPTLPVWTRVLPLSLALSLLCSIILSVCLSSFRMFESCLFWLLIIPVCTVFLLVSSSLFYLVFFFFSFFFPAQFPSIRVLPSLWSRDPVLSLLWLLLYKAVLLSSLLLYFFSSLILSLTTNSVNSLWLHTNPSSVRHGRRQAEAWHRSCSLYPPRGLAVHKQ